MVLLYCFIYLYFLFNFYYIFLYFHFLYFAEKYGSPFPKQSIDYDSSIDCKLVVLLYSHSNDMKSQHYDIQSHKYDIINRNYYIQVYTEYFF